MVPTRRAFLRTGGCAVALALAGCGDALRTGTPTRTSTPAPLPDRYRWEAEVEGTVPARPAVGDGTVYVAADREESVVLTAIDATDGTTRGRREVSGQRNGAPVAAAGGAVLATVRERRGVTGTVACLGPDGTVRWRTSPAAGRPVPLGATDRAVYAGWQGVERFDATPVVERERETASPLPTPTGTPVDRTERGVVAYGADDGTVRWRADPGDVTAGTLQAGRLFAANDIPPRLDVYDPDAEGSRRRWGRGMSQLPVAAGARAYLVDDGLLAVDVDTGRQRWRALGDARIRSVAADGRNVYVARGDGTVVALDGRGGEEQWRVTLGRVASPPAVVDGTVYAVGNGTTAALDAETGDVAWQVDLGAGSATPVVAPRTVYVRLGRWLHALDRRTGGRHWTFTPPSETALTPLAPGRDGRVFVASERGVVYGFGGRSER